MDPLLGEIRMFAGNFAPRGWAMCNGQLLSINQNTALFSILGTTYGGDGKTTFALPDLRGRAPIGQGAGPGLTSREPGEQGGTEGLRASANQKGEGHGFTEGDTTSSLMPPFLALTFIIAIEGVYPVRE